MFLPAAIAGCDDSITNPFASTAIDLGEDAGVLNYLYAIEQLELGFLNRIAAFNATRFAGMTAAELTAFTSILAHDSAHRDFLRRTLRSGRISDALAFDFESVDFSSRASVMTNARRIQDLAVAAYNGALDVLADPFNILMIGKIVSVEGRHSATIRDFMFLSGDGSAAAFAGDDVVDPTSGLDQAKSPATVIAESDDFFTTKISVRGGGE